MKLKEHDCAHAAIRIEPNLPDWAGTMLGMTYCDEVTPTAAPLSIHENV